MTAIASTALLNGAARAPGEHLLVVANRAYHFVPGKRATPLAESPAVAPSAAWADSSNADALPRLVDEGQAGAGGKPLTDVIVRGSAHSTEGPVLTIDTAVCIGAARKAVRAYGARKIVVKADGSLGFTSPEAFTELPLVWDHAYGGRDAHAEALLFDTKKRPSRLGRQREIDGDRLGKLAYPRNGAGRGYFLDVDRKRIDGTLAPRLEDPTDPVTADRLLSDRTTDWIDRPVAACYEPIDLWTFPRAQFFIPPMFEQPIRRVHELGSGAVLAGDLTRKLDTDTPPHPRAYSCAPAGLSVARLRGDERVQLWGLHRSHAYLEFELPADTPSMNVELPGVGVRSVNSLLSTVLVEPDLDRVTLTWVGVLPVAMPYPEEMLAGMRYAVTWKTEIGS